jgi:hypothetical protein
MSNDERQEVSIAYLAAQFGAACGILHDAYMKRDDVLIPFLNTAAMAVELSLLSIAGASASRSRGPRDGTRPVGPPFDAIAAAVVDSLEVAFARWSGGQVGS